MVCIACPCSYTFARPILSHWGQTTHFKIRFIGAYDVMDVTNAAEQSQAGAIPPQLSARQHAPVAECEMATVWGSEDGECEGVTVWESEDGECEGVTVWGSV